MSFHHCFCFTWL